MAMSGEHFTYPCSAVYSTEFKTPFHWIKFIPLPAQNLFFSYLIFPWLVNFGLLSTWNKVSTYLKEKKCHLMVVIITSVCYICIGLMIRYPSWDKDASWMIIHLQETTCTLILILKLKLGSTLKTRQLITILSNSSANYVPIKNSSLNRIL